MTPGTFSRKKRHAFEPDYAVPPGRTLQETIDTLGMDQRDLATRTGLSTKHINQIIQGIAPITQETALLLEIVTGVPARLWNNLEMNYREQLSRIEEQKRLIKDLAWLSEIPTAELVKRKKLIRHSDQSLYLKSVLGFFGVANVDAWKRVWMSPSFAFRKSKAFNSKPAAMATWLRLGEVEAHGISCQPFDKAKFRSTLEAIRSLTTERAEVFEPQMKKLCAEAGVAVVLVPEIKGAPASGAAQWLTPEKAMIQLSLRHKTNDHFWFSFFHEAGHILNDGKKEKFIDVNHGEGESEEKADRFASNILIPLKYAGELPKLKSPQTLKQFAQSIGIAPGIVVGRLQHDKIIGYNQLNSLKIRFDWVEQS
ncbi:MAG: helix-turn-helix domain-containing protein [Nitrospira sp.]|nr:helix-turn-helix domain-containing protein [Nitrospira sp.]